MLEAEQLYNLYTSTIFPSQGTRRIAVSLDHQSRILTVTSSLHLRVAISRKTPVPDDAHEVAACAGETCRKRGLS